MLALARGSGPGHGVAAVALRGGVIRKRAIAGGGREARVPSADDRIDEGDRLVIAGTRSAVEAMDVS